MSVEVIDDQILGQVLRGQVPREIRDAGLATTGCWYLRLCQAALRADGRKGRLSKPFAAMPEPLRGRALSAVLELPREIELVSLRTLAPQMAKLRSTHGLNLLSAEVLAAALHLEARVVLSADSPRLQEALADHDVAWHRIDVP